GYLHILPLQSIGGHLENVWMIVVLPDSLAWDGQHVFVFFGNDGDVYVDVGQQLVVMVINYASRFAYVSGAVHFECGGNGIYRALPDAAGNRVPGNFNGLSDREACDVRLVHKGADNYLGEIRFLQHQVAGIHIVSKTHGKGIDNAVERSADIELGENVFRGCVDGLGF